jgi:hypothetical protein
VFAKQKKTERSSNYYFCTLPTGMPLPVILGQFLLAGVSFGAIQPPLVCVRARAYVCATLSLSLSLHHHHHPLSLSVAAFGCVRSALSLTNPRYTVDSVLLVLGYVRACVCVCAFVSAYVCACVRTQEFSHLIATTAPCHRAARVNSEREKWGGGEGEERGKERSRE